MAETLGVSAAEREVALDEVRAVLASAREGDFRDELAALAAALEEGAVPGELVDALERIVNLGLQSGRIRHFYGPGAEQAALRLYRRLPGGVAVSASAEQVGAALTSLRGKTIESVAIEPLGPGAFAVSLAAGGVQLSVRLDRQGARLRSVEV